MGCVGQAESVGSDRYGDSLLHFEVTQHAQVHVEVSRTAELIAVGVPVMRIGCAGNQRGRKGGGIEVRTTRVALRTGHASARRLAVKKLEFTDQIGRLSRAVGFRLPPALTVNGTPLISLTIGLISQPPRIWPPTPLCTHRCPCPNGSAKTPQISKLCVRSKPAAARFFSQYVGYGKLSELRSSLSA